MAIDHQTMQANSITLGNLLVNFENYRVLVADEFIELTMNEFDVLRVLIEHRDHILPYSNLTELIWQNTEKRQVRHLNVLIHRLRTKLAGSSPYVIETVRGRGYGLLWSKALMQFPPEARGREWLKEES